MKHVLKDGDWWLVVSYGRHQILHRCEKAVFSWDRHPEYPNRDKAMRLEIGPKKAWASVKNIITSKHREWLGCMACEAVPPDEMQGFVRFLEWER